MPHTSRAFPGLSPNRARLLRGLAAAVISLAFVSWPLALIVVLITAAQLIFIHRISGPLDERVYAEQKKAAEAGMLATDFTLGLRVLKGFGGAEPTALSRYVNASRESMKAAIRTVRAMSSLTALNSGVSALVLASVALGAAWMAHQARSPWAISSPLSA